jgi:hypothetical protein
MRASLIVLAIALATLRLVQEVLARRGGRVALLRVARRRRLASGAASELRLAGRLPAGGGAAQGGRVRGGRETPSAGTRPTSRFAEWRYYGFRSHIAEVDDSSSESQDDVATSPAVGSVVSILPDDCVTTVVNGRVYCQCGRVWYQQQNTGAKVTYVVVPAP